MAESTLLHTQDTPASTGKGHGTGALGPSDSSDSGSDIRGGPGLNRDDGARAAHRQHVGPGRRQGRRRRRRRHRRRRPRQRFGPLRHGRARRGRTRFGRARRRDTSHRRRRAARRRAPGRRQRHRRRHATPRRRVALTSGCDAPRRSAPADDHARVEPHAARQRSRRPPAPRKALNRSKRSLARCRLDPLPEPTVDTGRVTPYIKTNV